MPIKDYPEFSDITLDSRPVLHPLFKTLEEGISEFSFANIYLFRKTHGYRVSRLGGGLFVISGADAVGPFFMLPFGLPDEGTVKGLFSRFKSMKAASGKTAPALAKDYRVTEDRDNFDYLYSRGELSALKGRKYHKKKNLVNLFASAHSCHARPLVPEHKKDALAVLEEWVKGQKGPGDYEAAKEALELSEELELCGGVYYIDGTPAAYTLGEELKPDTFAVHFEKALSRYKGLAQFVNQDFAARLPDGYSTINREQDLGEAGLRKAKLSYHPSGFVKKYRVNER